MVPGNTAALKFRNQWGRECANTDRQVSFKMNRNHSFGEKGGSKNVFVR